mmetsp:Transcript_3335/g.7523  ORF Transcript_3335/g.7523 Transcript_3335/m.7523 type:complete len:229 (+) Transcript_3335:67-753(+)|eukprot:CAMPEP_0171374404 /NCGR_PEP_ID=MMETSP0879-20121228/14731_1 /TAXON_ID=67004 /ORGANISM="Thalassiosira weissflogii, Strain CCMP1336" /LENGTH=228 /DNA_ID=CAMNT_0011883751 /DNA_START=27 /DNA_END=713 /DNA_ORIENTATION=-
MTSKCITKLAIRYSPPTFMFEYTKINRKFHKLVDIQGYIANNCANLTKEHVIRVILEKHNELEQVPMGKMEVLIDRLLDNMNRSLKRNETIRQGRLNTSHLEDDGSNESDSSFEEVLDESSATSPVASCKSQLTDTSMKRNNDKGIISSSQPEEIPVVNRPTTSVLESEKEHLRMIGDLNKVSPEELLRAKGKMNETFELTKVMPGDANYEYDKRVDFGDADEESSWD